MFQTDKSKSNPCHLVLAWVIFILFFNSTSNAQTAYIEVKHNYSEIFKKRYWNFFIRPLVSFQKGNYYKDKDFSFSLKSAPGFQFGWMMNFGLPKHFAIQTGINVEVNYIHIVYSVREDFFRKNIASVFNERTDNFLGFVLPVYLSYKIPFYNKNNNFFIEPKIGIDIKYGSSSKVSSESYSIIDDTLLLQTAFLNKGWDNNKIGTGYRLTASFVVGCGFNFILKNQRILNFQFFGTYNPFIKDYGTMTFIPGSPYEKKIPFRYHYNSLGFELNYLFTKYPKHITKKQAKKIVFQNAISK